MEIKKVIDSLSGFSRTDLWNLKRELYKTLEIGDSYELNLDERQVLLRWFGEQAAEMGRIQQQELKEKMKKDPTLEKWIEENKGCKEWRLLHEAYPDYGCFGGVWGITFIPTSTCNEVIFEHYITKNRVNIVTLQERWGLEISI